MYSSVKAIKKGLIYPPLWKGVLLASILMVTYFQWRKTVFDFEKIELGSYFLLLAVLVLTILQWYLEFEKWKIACKESEMSFSTDKIRSLFYQGMISGFTLPGGFGNYIGRAIGAKEEKGKVLPLTLYTNLMQFFPSVFFGITALFFLPSFFEKLFHFAAPKTSLGLLVTGLAVLWMVFAFLPFEKWVKIRNSWFFLPALPSSSRFQIVSLSLGRYGIFVLQFVSLMSLFGEEPSFALILGILVFYLFTTVSPGLFFGKVIVREIMAVWVLGAMGFENSIILLSAVSIWLCNNLLPVLFAVIVLKRQHG